MTIGQPKKIKYLTNKDLLAEIHRSKATFCSYTDDSYGQYDIILPSLEKVNIRTVAEAKRNRAARLSKLAHAEAVEAAGKKMPAKGFEIDYRKMQKEDLVFRIMTFDHVPLGCATPGPRAPAPGPREGHRRRAGAQPLLRGPHVRAHPRDVSDRRLRGDPGGVPRRPSRRSAQP